MLLTNSIRYCYLCENKFHVAFLVDQATVNFQAPEKSVILKPVTFETDEPAIATTMLWHVSF